MIFFLNKKGVTLIEMVVVIAILVMTFMASFSIQTTFLGDTYVDARTQDLVQALRFAQVRALAGFNDSNWGVHFNDDPVGDDDGFIVFSGASYALRDSSFDIVTDFPRSLSLTNVSLSGGGTDLVFAQVTGETVNHGSVEIVSGDLVNTISVNSNGVIDVE